MSLFILGFISLVLNICLYCYTLISMYYVFMVGKHWLYYTTFPLIVPVSYII